MAISYQIVPDASLVYVRYWDLMGIDESRRAMQGFMAHPLYRRGLRHLIDLTDVVDYDKDYANFLALQAEQLALFDPLDLPVLTVSLAPTPLGQKIANLVLRSWDNVPSMVGTVARDEAEALGLLGLRESSLAALLAEA